MQLRGTTVGETVVSVIIGELSPGSVSQQSAAAAATKPTRGYGDAAASVVLLAFPFVRGARANRRPTVGRQRLDAGKFAEPSIGAQNCVSLVKGPR